MIGIKTTSQLDSNGSLSHIPTPASPLPLLKKNIRKLTRSKSFSRSHSHHSISLAARKNSAQPSLVSDNHALCSWSRSTSDNVSRNEGNAHLSPIDEGPDIFSGSASLHKNKFNPGSSHNHCLSDLNGDLSPKSLGGDSNGQNQKEGGSMESINHVDNEIRSSPKLMVSSPPSQTDSREKEEAKENGWSLGCQSEIGEENCYYENIEYNQQKEFKIPEITKPNSQSKEKEKLIYDHRLRPRKIMNYKEKFEYGSLSIVSSDENNDESSSSEGEGLNFGSLVLPNDPKILQDVIAGCKISIKRLEKEFLESEHLYKEEDQEIDIPGNFPENAIPLCVDVMSYDFKSLAQKQKEITGELFDVIMIDPPWQLSSSNPTRGVAIAYDTLSDIQIKTLPLDILQESGYIFIWTINAKLRFTLELMNHWGYKYFDDITWIKQTVNGKIAKGHGFYLQHSKETCFIGYKGKGAKIKEKDLEDSIFSWRRGQSQKPPEIYDIIEKLVPNGYYIEIFGRRNNLRNGWVTVGNEL